MHMVRLNIQLDYLDIGIEVFWVLEYLKSVLLNSGYEDFSPISRGPDDVVFGFVDSMTTFSESH